MIFNALSTTEVKYQDEEEEEEEEEEGREGKEEERELGFSQRTNTTKSIAS